MLAVNTLPAHIIARTRAAIPPGDLQVLTAAAYAVDRARSTSDRYEAARWFGRATRLLPRDDNVAFLYAQALACIDSDAALLVVSRLLLRQPGWQLPRLLDIELKSDQGDIAGAAKALCFCLQHMACPGASSLDSDFAARANRVAHAAGLPGWVGLSRIGLIHAVAATKIAINGKSWRAGGAEALLPESYVAETQVAATRAGRALLGSPVSPVPVLALHGAVFEKPDGGIGGWVAATGDPALLPCVDVFAAASGLHLARLAATPGRGLCADAPIWAATFNAVSTECADVAVLRLFATETHLQPGDLATSRAGAWELAGSPLHVGAAARGSIAVASAISAMRAEPVAPRTGPARPGVTNILVTTVRSGGIVAPGWLDKILAQAGDGACVVWCASGPAPDNTAITCVPVAAHADYATRVNAGLRALALGTPRDVLLVHAGVGIQPGDLHRLRNAARRPGISAVAALHIGFGVAAIGDYGMPPAALSAALHAANDSLVVRLPYPDGPMIYLKYNALLDGVSLQEGVFGETSGAWAAFFVAATANGMQTIAACDVLADQPVPAREPVTSAFLATAIDSLDKMLWSRGRCKTATILITHAEGGGVERHVQTRAMVLKAQGVRAIIVRPGSDGNGLAVWQVTDAQPGSSFGFSVVTRNGAPALAELVRADGPVYVEFHHAASHDSAIEALPGLLNIPYSVWIHDYAPICPRVTLSGASGRYCGEPTDIAVCQSCVDTQGTRMPGATDVAAWRARSARLLAGAQLVRAPSQETARRISRYFPDVRVSVAPWDGEADTAVAPGRAPPRRKAGALHVCVLGALTLEKGFDVLLACGRDAAQRSLPLRFTLVGHSVGDMQLLETGCVFVTGPFAEGDAPSLLAATNADMALLPAVWPETWSYALSDLWRAGLFVVAFDLGAPAARIRANGGGVVLPAGLPASRLNDALLGVPIAA